MTRLLGFCSLLLLLNSWAAAPAAEPPLVRQPAARDANSASLLLTWLGDTCFRHGSMATSVSFSADGKLLASSHQDHVVRLWDPATGKEIRRLVGHDTVVRAVALSADGKRAASAGYRDQSVRIWDTGTGKELFRLEHEAFTCAVAIAPDGTTVVSGDIAGCIYLWDAATGKQLHKIKAHEGRLSAICFAPDGKEFASCSYDRKVRRWDLNTAQLIKEVAALPTKVGALAYSADGKTLATGSFGGLVTTWNIGTGRKTHEFKLENDWILALAFTADMKNLAVAGLDKVGVQMLDLETDDVRHLDLGSDTDKGAILGLALAPGGKTLVVAGKPDSLLQFDPVSLARLENSLDRHHGPVNCLSFAPDSESLTWGGPDSVTLRINEVNGGKAIHEIKLPGGGVHELVRSADGKYLAVRAGSGNAVHLWDAARGTPLEEFNKQKQTAARIAFTPDGRHLQGWCADRTLRLWECASGKEIKSASWPQARLDYVILSPIGTQLAALDRRSRQTYILGLPDLQELVQLNMEGAKPFTGVFSSDGRLLVLERLDGCVDIWDTRTGAAVDVWQISSGAFHALALSPDGKTLAVCSRNESDISLFELATHRLRALLRGHCQAVVALAFAPGGRLLASGSQDETCVIWDLTGRRVAGLEETAKLAEKDIAALWDRLLADDAGVAWRASWELVAGGDSVVAVLKQKVTPAAKASADRIAKLIANLDDDDFAVREAASLELGRVGTTAAPALRKGLAQKPPLEVVMRIELLLENMGLGPVPSGERLRHLRAVEVLEQIGTQQARTVLETLAGGNIEDALTREAGAALKRLTAREKSNGVPRR